MKKLIIVGAVSLALGLAGTAVATPNTNPPKKYFVCKYVGTPGADERLQTGNNPISVSENALDKPVVIGAFFNDKQGRSVAVAEDTGQAEPSCETTTPVDEPPVVTPTPVTPTDTPVQSATTQTTVVAEQPGELFIGK